MSRRRQTISCTGHAVSAAPGRTRPARITWLHLRRPLGLAAVLLIATPLGGCFLAGSPLSPPSVTDVSSDLENPPAFQALAGPRREAGFPATYPGGETAAMQKYSYPEIKSLPSSLPPSAAYGRALNLVRKKGWEVVEAIPPGPGPGRIEATAQPTMVSKPDDVVIRLAAAKHGSTVVDIRSAARHDRRDLGTNARRVSDFLFELRDVLLTSN